MPLKINGSTSGSVTLAAPATGSDVTLTLPGTAGTVALAPSAWTDYTPTLVNWTLGNGTLTGSYAQIGKVVFARIYFKVGSTTTKSASGLGFSLPVSGRSYTGLTMIGTAYFEDFGVAGYAGLCRYDNSNVYLGYISSASSAFSLAANTSPFTWGTDDYATLSITYEAA